MKTSSSTQLARSYVRHGVVNGITDAYDADLLWKAPNLFWGPRLLRDIVSDIPAERRGRSTKRYFCHVELLLPREEVEHDRRISRGERGAQLCAALAELHLRDFGKFAGDAGSVRYRIAASDDLGPDEVAVKIGHAVYVPAPDESAPFSVSISVDGVLWQPVCEIYSGQRLTLLGENPLMVSHAVSGWPFGSGAGLMLINEPGAATPEIDSEPRGCLLSQFDPQRNCYVVRMPTEITQAQASEAKRLLLKVEKLAPPEVRAPSHTEINNTNEALSRLQDLEGNKPSPASAARDPQMDRETFTVLARSGLSAESRIDCGTYLPTLGGRVCLVALALQRPSCFPQAGVESLAIAFDRKLRVVPGDGNKQTVLTIRLDKQDCLSVETAKGAQNVTLPSDFEPRPGSIVRLRLPPKELMDRYAAMLELPEAVTARLGEGTRIVVGRGNPMLAELRILDDPGFLVLSPESEQSTPDRLGLSRKAFVIEAKRDRLELVRHSPQQSIFHLNEEMEYVASIMNDKPENPYSIPVGHHWIAGHYVLRYEY